MTELEKFNEATTRFMRGKYALDGVANGRGEVAFRFRIHHNIVPAL